ncbi:beta-L-arabinofuranosidase domain-containing protein [Dactylosporangium sp. CA-052675]|uniref:beta-L-arabinofuranosidase domain-containing protein n=1 Tax=Dactylosporangium sp. CA-052675 TaxID=3239927 RepID=UPI003D8B70CB
MTHRHASLKLAGVPQQTGDARWLAGAQRFDHAAVFNPLASNTDQLNGLHANTQVPKWIGAARSPSTPGRSRRARTRTVEALAKPASSPVGDPGQGPV